MMPPAAAPAEDPKARAAGMVLGAGAAICVIGSFLTWASLKLDLREIPSGGVTSESTGGLSSSDGKIVLILGLIMLGFAYGFIKRAGKPKVFAILGIVFTGLVILPLTIYDITTAKNDAQEAFVDKFKEAAPQVPDTMVNEIADQLEVNIGIGLYASVVGGAIALIGSIMGLGIKTPEGEFAAMTPPAPPPGMTPGGIMPPPPGSPMEPPGGMPPPSPMEPPPAEPPGGPPPPPPI